MFVYAYVSTHVRKIYAHKHKYMHGNPHAETHLHTPARIRTLPRTPKVPPLTRTPTPLHRQTHTSKRQKHTQTRARAHAHTHGELVKIPKFPNFRTSYTDIKNVH